MSMLKTNAARKLTREQVIEIRGHLAQGITQGSLARYYGVAVGTIGRIARGESWGEVTGGAAAPSPANMDGILARVMKVQEEVLAAQAGGEVMERPARRVPPSPLDEEGEGVEAADAPSGLSALQQRAASFGMDIEKLLTNEGEG